MLVYPSFSCRYFTLVRVGEQAEQQPGSSQLFATCCVHVTHLASFGPMLHSDGNRAYFWTPIYVEAASSTLVRKAACAGANVGDHAAGRSADRRQRLASPHLTTRKRGRSSHSAGL